MAFLEKQVETIAERYHAQDQEDWKIIEAYLEEKGLLKDYNKDTHNLSFNMEENLMKLEDESDKEEHPLAKLLRGMKPIRIE